MNQRMLTRIRRIDQLFHEKSRLTLKEIHNDPDMMNCSLRTTKRDIQYLRDSANAPIEYDYTGEKPGYYLTDPAWTLMGLDIGSKDLFMLLIIRQFLEQYKGTPLSEYMDSIYTKVEEYLGTHVTLDADLYRSYVSSHETVSVDINPEAWSTILEGLQKKQTVKIRYKGLKDTQYREKSICPYHLTNIEGIWYVLAGSPGSNDYRQYNMGRIKSARLSKLSYEIPESFDAEALLENTFGRFVSDDKLVNVRVLIKKKLAPWATERRWHKKQKIKKRKNGDIEISFPVSASGPWPLHHVMMWVLSYGSNAIVLEPEALKQMVQEEARGILSTWGRGSVL